MCFENKCYWSRSSGVERLPLKEMVGGSNPPEITALFLIIPSSIKIFCCKLPLDM